MLRAASAWVLLMAPVVGCAPEGPTAFITASVDPDAMCVVQPVDQFNSSGLFDISDGPPGGSGQCSDRSYFVGLVVNSYLRSNQDMDLGRAEPNVLQLHSAEIRLTTVDGRTIVFADADPPLPNPFLVTTAASLFPTTGTDPSRVGLWIEVIPSAYAPFLSDFVGGKMLAEIQIFGRTTGDVDVDLAPFKYPIRICDGCLMWCLERDIKEPNLTIEDIEGNGCVDNAGADERPCIDDRC